MNEAAPPGSVTLPRRLPIALKVTVPVAATVPEFGTTDTVNVNAPPLPLADKLARLRTVRSGQTAGREGAGHVILYRRP